MGRTWGDRSRMDLSTALNQALAERYTITAEIGRGGMATIFRATDLRHHRAVAVKVLDPVIAAAVGADRFAREIDIADYVNPYFDESYNVPHFWGRRRGLALAVIREQYAHRAEHPLVMERFRRYETAAPSRSVQLVRDFFIERNRAPQRDQVFTALDLPPDYPIALLASAPVP